MNQPPDWMRRGSRWWWWWWWRSGVCILSGESSDGREARVEGVQSAIWGTRGLADGDVSNQSYDKGHEEWD